jgi:enediyne biosynthesis protein E3
MRFGQSVKGILPAEDSRIAVASNPANAREGAVGRGERWLRGVLRSYGTYAIRSVRRKTAARQSPLRTHLDRIVEAFMFGYGAALDVSSERALIVRLSPVEPERRGFAFEGAAMAVVLLDLLMPWNRGRFRRLVAAAPQHIYLLHVGAGWALARLRCGEGRSFRRLDPVLRWLAIDGMGFHDGYFGGPDLRRRRPLSARLSVSGARVFDQGLGRSLWFTTDADPARIGDAISRTAADRHADLWSGVGLACAYAGGGDGQAIETLRDASGTCRAAMAQGVAFAAEAHLRGSGEVPMHTERACRLICGTTAAAAAAATREAAHDLDAEGARAYEVWRTRLRSQLRPLFERSAGT